MSIVLISDLEAADVPITPCLMASRESCGCCGQESISLCVLWLFWGIGLALHID